MKTCHGCGESKPLGGFHKNKSMKDGRMNRCKACTQEYMASYYQANREKIEANIRDYREANRDAVIERNRAYRGNHPEAGWSGRYRHRVKVYGFDPVVEDFTYRDVVNLYGDACVHCGGDFEHLDHYPVPVSKGGHHTLANVAPSCAFCNRSRGNAEPRQEEALF